MSGVTTGDNSQFKLINKITHNAYAREEDQKTLGSLVTLVALLIIVGVIALSHALQHDPGVEKWMDVSTTLGKYVPDAKTEYDRSTNEVKSLENEFETTRRKLALKADVFNAISPEDQSRLAELQHRMDAARESQKRQYHYIVRFLTTSLQSRTLITKGYNQRRQQWECPLYDYWEYLKLSGDLTDTSMSITGGLSAQVRLVQVKFGKPLGSGPDELCQVSDDGTLGQ